MLSVTTSFSVSQMEVEVAERFCGAGNVGSVILKDTTSFVKMAFPMVMFMWFLRETHLKLNIRVMARTLEN